MGWKACHKATEVHPGLWLSEKDDPDLLKQVSVIVPLNTCGTQIFDVWDGEIIYYPTPDFGVLPDKIALRCASQIIKRLKKGLKVGVYCFGGHGRTGWMAAIVLGLLGNKDPIGHIRKIYCKHAVESETQIKSIVRLLDNKSQLKYNGAKCYASAGHDKGKSKSNAGHWWEQDGGYSSQGDLPFDSGIKNSKGYKSALQKRLESQRACFFCGFFDPNTKYCGWKKQKILDSQNEICETFGHYQDPEFMTKSLTVTTK